MGHRDSIDVAVVGAGAAGVGVSVALSQLDIDVRIFEREGIGASFREWPAEMRFITPSFPSNGFGLPDLNTLVPRTAPAVLLDCQQPSGDDYARYLSALVDHYNLDVETGVEVRAIEPLDEHLGEADDRELAVDGGIIDTGQGFAIETNGRTRYSEFVVWAGGQFGTPRTDIFPGSEQCLHNSAVDSWSEHAASADSEEFLVVGGFESGIDAAVNLVETGCSVTVLDRGHPWALRHPDPSKTLSPYTLQRLDEVRHSDRLTLVGGANVERVEHRAGGFEVLATPVETDLPADASPESFKEYTEGRFTVPTRPILATGFEPNLGPVSSLFPRENGTVELTERDESPTTPGLFLSGPAVTHDGQEFCFIYKFRSRFPVVAEEIGERLGVETDPLSVYEDANMFLDDLSCCEPVDCNC